MFNRIVFCLLFVMYCWQTAVADELIFKNGDRLTGKVKKLADGKLVFESNVAGIVTVAISNIQTFKTDEAVEVHLTDGTSFEQIILNAEPNLIAVKGDEKLKQQEFAIEKIVSISPLPKPEPKWTGDISAGISASRGNTVTESTNISLNMSRRSEKDRSLVSGYYIKSKQEDPDTGEKITTEDEWWLRGKHDYFITKKFYVFGDGRYETDAIAELDRRVILGAGAGRQWVESEDLNFSTEAGLASLYEKYENQTGSDMEISAQLGYHFDTKVNSRMQFIHDLTYYPSLEHVSDYLLTTAAELRASITERIFTNFKVIFEYDATPAEGATSTDVKYLWGVGFKF